MRRFFTALLLILIGLLPARAADPARVLIYGDAAYPPYSYVEQGQFRGLYVEALREIAQGLAPDYEIELRPVPWRRGLRMLEQGEALVLFPPYRRAEREYIARYSPPLLTETVVLVCREGLQPLPRSFPAQFAGLRIGVNAGFALSDGLVEARQKGLVQVEDAVDSLANLRKLQLGHLDCYANDRRAIALSLQLLNQQLRPGQQALRLNEATELSAETVHLAYGQAGLERLPPGFIARLDAAIAAYVQRGGMERLLRRYALASPP